MSAIEGLKKLMARKPALKRAWISPEVMGSDHCPVGLELG